MRTELSILAAASFSLCATTWARPAVHHPHGVIDAVANSTLIKAALENQYDFVVVGGGTAGLAVAARLSENSSNTVLVLEAGLNSVGNPGIDIPAFATSIENTPLDWNFTTIPQPHINGTVVPWLRGKVLSGSSAMNIMIWNRGRKADYDAWSRLGNSGWDWKSLLPYHKKSESFHKPGGNQLGIHPAYETGTHGTQGPIQVSYNPYISPHFQSLFKALRSFGIREAKDGEDGNNRGVAWVANNIDPATQVRSSSYMGYIKPNLGRKNLLIITSAYAGKVKLESRGNNKAVIATGVEFSAGENMYTALESALVDLPGVGENLQDHPLALMVFKLKAGLVSFDTFLQDTAFAAAAQVQYSMQQGILTQAAPILSYFSPEDFMSESEIADGRKLVAAAAKGISVAQKTLLLEQYNTSSIIEVAPLNENTGGIVPEPGAAYFTIAAALQNPLSRGMIHITSKDRHIYPSIDPMYLSQAADGFHLAKGARYIRRVTQSSLFLDVIDREVKPGLDVVPANATTAEWESRVHSHVGTEYHPIGTASMLPRSARGVVDTQLKVYGTKNLRVVDASIMPLHRSTHIQSTVFANAERAADIIIGQV